MEAALPQPATAAQAAAKAALAHEFILGLPEGYDTHIGEKGFRLSGGERQRLLISQALLGRPKLLLLDEPLISLDPTHQQGVVDLVKRLQVQFGMTVVFSAHELNPLLNAMDRVLYIGSGRAALGSIDEVVTGPVLSKLYGSPIEVLRMGTRVFVVNGDVEVERGAHLHEGCAHHHHAAHPEAERRLA